MAWLTVRKLVGCEIEALAPDGGKEDTVNDPGTARPGPSGWLPLVAAVALLGTSALLGWGALAFVSILLAIALAARAVRRSYDAQSRRPEGVSPGVRFLEAVRCYLADEDPPASPANRGL